VALDYEYRDYADIYGDFRDTTTGRVTDPTGRVYDLVVVKNTPDAVRTTKDSTPTSATGWRGAGRRQLHARGHAANVAGEDAGSGPIRASLNDFPEVCEPELEPAGRLRGERTPAPTRLRA
jgi:hypothetical protein